MDCFLGMKDDDRKSLTVRAGILKKRSKAEGMPGTEVTETRAYIRAELPDVRKGFC